MGEYNLKKSKKMGSFQCQVTKKSTRKLFHKVKYAFHTPYFLLKNFKTTKYSNIESLLYTLYSIS